MSAVKTETPEKPAKKASKRRLALLGVALLLLAAAAGGGACWWTSNRAAQAATGSTHATPASVTEHAGERPGALPFEPFVVNLADTGRERYLKADIRLLVSGVENIEELEEDEVIMLRLRSAILEHLSQQTADAIVTPEGKDALKKAIAERCSKILGHARVTDVLFAEFVVQF
jgi:flagellar FliL protein